MKNTNQNILRIAIPTPLYRLFDYLCPEDVDSVTLVSGMRIKVPFGKSKKVIGIFLETVSKSEVAKDKLKFIDQVLDEDAVITPDVLKLCEWAADYYHYPLGEVLFNALPVKLRKGKPAKFKKELDIQKFEKEDVLNTIELNQAQQKAVTKILPKLNQFMPFLLDGITGSGKTEVYIRVIQEVIRQGKQALILVPEIALTPQTLSRFINRFNVPVVSIHSALNVSERLDAWLAAKTGMAKIIIGTRSAVFTPCNDLGVVIVDEEHDLSFKQQDNFRYSARDLALVRARQKSIPLVLGSATPSLESLYNAKNKRYRYLHLPERAGTALYPAYRVIDVCDVRLTYGLSKRMLKVIEDHLEKDNQVMLFLNRRGYAPTLMCHSCGWMANCDRCDVRMTLHQNPAHLRCHHCNSYKPIPSACPNCKNTKLKDMGVGTERLEIGLKKHFPDIPVVRIDRDTTRRKNSLNDMLTEIHKGKRQILIGTQMLAKGHHFPNVTLVCIVNIDGGFFSADFRAAERTAQLIIQVAGRAGRADKLGHVFIQTHYPEHPLLVQLIKEGYKSFAKLALQEREEIKLPPYMYLALLRAEAFKKELPDNFLNEVKDLIGDENKKVSLLGPIPAPIQRVKGRFCTQLLLQASKRADLHKVLGQIVPQIEKMKASRKVRWSLDVDPMVSI